MTKELVKSISESSDEILTWIQKLYGEIECDVTYSKGVFYKHLSRPKLRFDINPVADGVDYADCRNLPLEDSSINTIMYDPPFLATTGKSLKEYTKGQNCILHRFGVYPSEKELFKFYYDSLKEFHRVLKTNGYLYVKCQDKVSGGVQYWSHVYIMNYAQELGFYCEDLFILKAKSRMTPKWQVDSQKHSRKFHSYFLVFRKLSDKDLVKENKILKDL